MIFKCNSAIFLTSSKCNLHVRTIWTHIIICRFLNYHVEHKRRQFSEQFCRRLNTKNEKKFLNYCMFLLSSVNHGFWKISFIKIDSYMLDMFCLQVKVEMTLWICCYSVSAHFEWKASTIKISEYVHFWWSIFFTIQEKHLHFYLE